MTRQETHDKLLTIFRDEFEIENPGVDDDLRDVHEFDSIDAIELLREIEIMLRTELTQEEKKEAMEIRTISHILDYVETMAERRA
ncbi:MAG: acyl carrier protein [Deltaproteobacteria bacterium]|nr:acyl carrier protein [Deltaproteobacteria bacterium]